MSIYKMMNIGEKRSLTSSIKKGIEEFLRVHQRLQLTYPTPERLWESFYAFWLQSSIDASYSWCREEKNYITQDGFKEEMIEKIKELAEESLFLLVREEPSVSERLPLRGEKVGRNEPCPCGSQKKYKKCCLRKQEGIMNPSSLFQHIG